MVRQRRKKPRDPRANPVERFAWGEEEQGSVRSFCRQAETEDSELCSDEGAERSAIS